MPQSLANLLTHLIFSTKNREPFLAGKGLQQSAHGYLSAVLKDQKSPAVIVGGCCQPCSYSLPVGKDGIDFESDGAFEGVFFEMVEDATNLRVQLATRLRSVFCKPVSSRFRGGVYPKPSIP